MSAHRRRRPCLQKRRHCKFDAIPGKKYCGNHIYFAEVSSVGKRGGGPNPAACHGPARRVQQQCRWLACCTCWRCKTCHPLVSLAQGTGPKRVPCPWDPKGGHTVLESELEKHKHKCPGYRRLMAEQAQPFYSQGINGGQGEEVQWPAEVAAAVAAEAAAAEAAAAAAAAAGEAPRRRRGRGAEGPAALQAAYAAALGEQGFEELLRRIEAACEQVRLSPQAERVPCVCGHVLFCLCPRSVAASVPWSLQAGCSIDWFVGR